MHERLYGSGASGETRLDLNHSLLGDPQTQRVRFTRLGQNALAARFARSGVDIRRLRTLDDVETAIARVTPREYHRLTATAQKEDEIVDALHDLDFITDRLTGQPLLPLKARRERRNRGYANLFTAIGITVQPL